MTDVGKTADGTDHVNTVVIPRIKVYFQCIPGEAGSENGHGIADVEYVLRIGGKRAGAGRTARDGSITLNVPAGSHAVLEIFDTEYEIKVLNRLESAESNKGEQRRLQLLGYELGEVDGIHGRRTDYATLNFQADHWPLDPDGDIGPKTRRALAELCDNPR